MGTITTEDGTEIYYKDWGEGPVVTLSHGWPLSADAWDGQMLFLAEHGFRVVAHDRRAMAVPASRRRATTWTHTPTISPPLIEALDLHDVTLVGHSTGGGEVARIWPARNRARREGRPDLRGTAEPREVRGEPRRSADGTVRRSARRPVEGSLAVLPGPRDPVLQREPARCQRLARRARPVLGVEHAIGPEELVRVRQGPVRERLHRRPRALRCPDAVDPRRGRPGGSRRQLEAVGEHHQERQGHLLPGRAARHHRDSSRPGQRRHARLLGRASRAPGTKERSS